VMVTLVVPVPRPASLNEVVSDPVVVLTLLFANRKCAPSASAEVAVSPMQANAEMTTIAVRRLVSPP